MGLLRRSVQIIKNQGLREYMKAIKRYLLWHPVVDETWWQFNRLVRSQPEVIRNVQGSSMLLDISQEGIHKHLFLYGCHEPECTRIFRRMLPRGARVVDVGANIGYYVLMEAQVAQEVYAIEPEPRNLELLRKNVELNSCGDRVEVHELALSDTTGEGLLSIGHTPNQHRLRAASDTQQARYIKVSTTTLDEFLKDREVDVVRMDLEGAEWLVVKGMMGILRGNKPLILFVEVHSKSIKDYGGDAMTMLKLLLDSGFRMRHLVVFRPAALSVIPGGIRARALPQEQVVECHSPLADPFLDKNVHQILDESVAYRLFMERGPLT